MQLMNLAGGETNSTAKGGLPKEDWTSLFQSWAQHHTKKDKCIPLQLKLSSTFFHNALRYFVNSYNWQSYIFFVDKVEVIYSISTIDIINKLTVIRKS